MATLDRRLEDFWFDTSWETNFLCPQSTNIFADDLVRTKFQPFLFIRFQISCTYVNYIECFNLVACTFVTGWKFDWLSLVYKTSIFKDYCKYNRLMVWCRCSEPLVGCFKPFYVSDTWNNGLMISSILF